MALLVGQITESGKQFTQLINNAVGNRQLEVVIALVPHDIQALIRYLVQGRKQNGTEPEYR